MTRWCLVLAAVWLAANTGVYADTLFEARDMVRVWCVVRIDSHNKQWRAETVEGCLPYPRYREVRLCAALKQYAERQPGQTYNTKLQVIKEIEAVKACAHLDPPPKP